MKLHSSCLGRSAASRRGGALAASLVVAVLLAGLGAGLVQLQTSVTQRHLASIDRARALYIAEAGLAEATLALAQGRSGAIAAADAPARHGGGYYWVESSEGEQGQLRLVSTGIVGRSSSSIEATVDPAASPFGAAGFFGAEEVVLLPGSRALAGDKPARVRSNGDVSVASSQGGARVEGDVVAGPTGLVDVGQGARVDGAISRAEVPLDWPEIVAPELPLLELDTELGKDAPAIGPGGLHLERLDLDGGQRARLVGPLVMTVGTLDLASGTRLRVDATGGPVVVHVLHEVRLAPGSRWVHEGGSADQVTLVLHQTHEPELSAKGTFVGALLAPHAELTLPSGLEVQGTAFARRLVFAQGSRATWDSATADRVAGVPSQPVLLSWGFAERPDTPLLGGLLPPKRWLAQQGVEPVSAQEEAGALEVTVQFVTEEGGIGVYQGPASELPTAAAQASLATLWEESVSGPQPGAPTPQTYPPPGSGAAAGDSGPASEDWSSSDEEDDDDHEGWASKSEDDDRDDDDDDDDDEKDED
jgi:hypothetical protein